MNKISEEDFNVVTKYIKEEMLLDGCCPFSGSKKVFCNNLYFKDCKDCGNFLERVFKILLGSAVTKMLKESKSVKKEKMNKIIHFTDDIELTAWVETTDVEIIAMSQIPFSYQDPNTIGLHSSASKELQGIKTTIIYRRIKR